MREIIKVSLREAEYLALEKLADAECRPIPLQAQHIIAEALRHHRLLPQRNLQTVVEPE